MKVHQLYRKTFVPAGLDKTWDFFSDPKNLKVITPDQMGFHILSGADRKMYPGQIITYTVKPLLGIPMTWVTEITHVKDKEFFVDNQRFGPYAMWHHKHFFKEKDNGVEMEDLIDYVIPFGPLGQIANSLIVKNQLQEIFDYREKVVKEVFG